ncbi:hypothetical protein [Bdellovibrio sp. HCB2-146]|uniref:hypothetical protein n=1 Tax=Bdellovibrio sp. HCB2-146 TaxID=3394362 RepID=UPI0039BCFCDC
MFCSLALAAHWSDSELWALGLARDFFHSAQPSTDYKFLFNLVLNLSYWENLDNLQTVQAARLIFATIGLGALGLFSYVAYQLTGSQKRAAWSAFLFIVSPLFLLQAFRLRSDALAFFWQMAALAHYLGYRKKFEFSKIQIAIQVFLNVLILLATPKGLFQLIVNGVAIFLWERKGFSRKSQKLMAIPAVIVFVSFAVLLIWKHSQFWTALVFFFKSYSTSPHHPGFLTVESFLFVKEAILQQLVYVVVFAGMLFYSKREGWKLQYPDVGAAALTALLLIILHNDRLPFFIYSLAGFPILYVALNSYEFFWNQPSKYNRVLGYFCVGALFIQAFFPVARVYREKNNIEQIELQSRMHLYLQSYRDVNYYDATVVLPRDNKIFIFPAPEHEGNKGEVLGVLEDPKLDLVFFGNRLFYYMNEFYSRLEQKYFIEIGRGVFARSKVVFDTSSINEEQWKKICSDLDAKSLYMYEGPHFLAMKPMLNGVVHSCSGPAPQWKTEQEFVAFSAFAPFEISNEKSFSQVFDSSL